MYTNYEIIKIDRGVGVIPHLQEFLKTNHYIKGLPRGIKFTYVLKIDTTVKGIAMFGTPVGRMEPKVIELKRFALSPNAEKNSCSWFMSKCLKDLSSVSNYEKVISYADPKQGHTGTIYKASNFMYIGKQKQGTPFFKVGSKRVNYRNVMVANKYKEVKGKYLNGTIELKRVAPKHIFIYNLKRKEKKVVNNVTKTIDFKKNKRDNKLWGNAPGFNKEKLYISDHSKNNLIKNKLNNYEKGDNMKSSFNKEKEVLFTSTSMRIKDFISANGFRSQIENGEVRLNDARVSYLKEHAESVFYKNASPPVLTSPKIQGGSKYTILSGHHRQKALAELAEDGAIDLDEEIPVILVNKKITFKEQEDLALDGNSTNTFSNSKIQIDGASDAAKKLYKPIKNVIQGLDLTFMSPANSEKITRYLASLFNYSPEMLRNPDRITASLLYSQRHTALGKGKSIGSEFRFIKPSMDLNEHTTRIYNIIAPGLLMLEEVMKDEVCKELIGKNKQIYLLFIALSAQKFLADPKAGVAQGLLTCKNIISVFQKKDFELDQVLIDYNNDPAENEKNFIRLLRTKSGLPIFKVKNV